MVSMREDWITFLRLIFVLCYILCLCGRQCYLVENSVPRDLDENSLDDDKLRRLKMMNIEENQQLADLSEYTAFHTIYLRHLLRVRVPGTLGHQKVRNFIVDNLKSSGWSVELDRFSTLTPIGRMTFTNIVAFLNPRADRHLALVAHYDSKLVPPKNGQYFLGATDSAVPCAMLLDFAKELGEKSKMFIDRSAPVSPMLIFLDGEEAFVEWTKTDSLYGARHLAEVMSKQPHHNHYLAQRLVTMLDSLDAFVLLDLIGAKNPRFYDIYPSTSHLYSRIQEIELQLMHAGVISNRNPYFPGKPEEYFQVEDDHEPFLRRGVPILHLIHVPFPNVWHTLGDNESALDEETIVNLLHIFRRFLLDYFELM